MPLVWITTSPSWSPKAESSLGGRTANGQVVFELGAALPGMLSTRAGLMKIEPFSPEVVQVKHESFAVGTDINFPDIWILVHIGEELDDTRHADAERVIADAIKAWSDANDDLSHTWFRTGGPLIVVEVTCGRLHGRFYSGSKKVAEW